MTTSVQRRMDGERQRILLGAHVQRVLQTDGLARHPTMIGARSHAEAEARVEIGGEKEDEVGVVTVTVPEGVAESALVTTENVTIAGTEKERGSEVEAREDEIETTTEKGGVEVAIRTGKGDEVVITKIPGEEAVRIKKEAEKETGHAADK